MNIFLKTMQPHVRFIYTWSKLIRYEVVYSAQQLILRELNGLIHVNSVKE